DGVLGVDRRLAARQLTHEALAGAREGDHRGRGPAAFGVGDDDRLATLHHRHHAVGGAEIDADGFGHGTDASGIFGMAPPSSMALTHQPDTLQPPMLNVRYVSAGGE